jgi:hypothetical protein
MTPPKTDVAIEAMLSSVDAAPPQALTDQQTARAAATLSMILAADPGAGEATERVQGVSTVGFARRRWAVLVGVAATGALLFNLLPGSPGVSTTVPPSNLSSVAFVSWTAVPVRLTLDGAGEAARYCQEHGADHTDAATEAAAAKSTVAIAERRGVWTYVLLAGADGFGVGCLTDGSFKDGHIGWAGAPVGYRPPAAREIRLGNCCGGGGTIRDGVKNLIGEVDGYAGTDVAKVVALTPAKGAVEATVAHGRFVAWWPDNNSDTRPRAPMTFQLTFTDGATQQVTLASG